MREERQGDQRYVKSCRADFWQRVFRFEADYLAGLLGGCRDVLGVGCGPAVVEAELTRRGYRVTGLDASPSMLPGRSAELRAVVARAEGLPFPADVFDAVIFVVSLQFVEDYREAVGQAARVLKPEGTLVALLLNPASDFFRKRRREPDSYVHGVRHADVGPIADTVAGHFRVRTEYLLGVRGETLFESRDPGEAVLYSVAGVKRADGRRGP
ncbi:MAG: class I SAM-dependent methyltransferase [Acidobacteria bacterium]|nr:class I SAM-dependent methyltransferase [Acidobacteriota bacterium]